LRRAEVWWADLPPPAGRRPVVLLSRDEAYAIRELVTVALVTGRIRGLPVEVPLGRGEGLPRACAANVDSVTTIPRALLTARIAYLPLAKRRALDDALRFSLGLEGETPKLEPGPWAA
jgi:mRNA interferase MazF